MSCSTYVVLTVNNVNEAPTFASLTDRNFTVSSSASTFASVGYATATDDDSSTTSWGTLTYSISSSMSSSLCTSPAYPADTLGSLAIKPSTGELYVADASTLVRSGGHHRAPFCVAVTATDGGGLSDSTAVFIDVVTGVYQPEIANQNLTIPEDTASYSTLTTITPTNTGGATYAYSYKITRCVGGAHKNIPCGSRLTILRLL